MTKRAATILITDAKPDESGRYWAVQAVTTPTEQLLTDLMILVHHAEETAHLLYTRHGADGKRWAAELEDAAARVRALLPNTGEEAA